jgi:uncharacterized protein (DUF1800 family)
MIHDLASAPATALHVARKLAQHFVADEPPQALVLRLAKVFTDSGGDLKEIYKVLISSPEVWQTNHSKFKSPWDWTISSMRALGRRSVAPSQVTALLTQLGQPVWRPGSPAGFKDTTSTWASPDALMRRVEIAQRLAQESSDSVDARILAPRVLPDVLTEATSNAIARAESRGTAVALLLISPEFLRR